MVASSSMSARRRPWSSSAAALVLGVLGFAVLFAGEGTDDYAGWAPVVTVLQLLWLWTVDLRSPVRRLDGVGRFMVTTFAACWVLVLLGGMGLAGVDAGVCVEPERTWLATAMRGAALLLLIPAGLWVVGVWRNGGRHRPELVIAWFLGPLTVAALPILIACAIAHGDCGDSPVFLAGIVVEAAMVGVAVVLAWTAIPWLELVSSRFWSR